MQAPSSPVCFHGPNAPSQALISLLSMGHPQNRSSNVLGIYLNQDAQCFIPNPLFLPIQPSSNSQSHTKEPWSTCAANPACRSPPAAYIPSRSASPTRRGQQRGRLPAATASAAASSTVEGTSLNSRAKAMAESNRIVGLEPERCIMETAAGVAKVVPGRLPAAGAWREGLDR